MNNSIVQLETNARKKAKALGHTLGRLARWTYLVGTKFNPTGKRERPRIGGSMYCVKCGKGVLLRVSPKRLVGDNEEFIAGFGVRGPPGFAGAIGKMVWWQTECGVVE